MTQSSKLSSVVIGRQYEGFFEKGKFIPNEPVVMPEHKKAIVTILDETEEEERKKRQMAALAECYRLLDESMDEQVPDFPRANLHRDLEI